MTTTILNGQARTSKPIPGNRTTGKCPSARRMPKADAVLYWGSALAPWGLAVLLLGVSMPHLATGFQSITHCGPLAGWLLAIAIDSAQIVSKLQLTISKKYALGTAAVWTAAGIVCGTTAMSAVLNVLGFLAGATDRTGTVLSYSAGILLPVLVLALSYTGSSFVLAKAKKEAK